MTFLQSLLSGIARKVAGRDVRLGLIASQNAAISGVSVPPETMNAFAPGTTREVNFELAPKDAFIGTLVAGCPAETSDLNATHVPGTVTVCSRSVTVPAHSWTWTTEDLKGRLSDFLRPNAKRIYIFVASNDVALMNSKDFVDLVVSQTGGMGAIVLAIIPIGPGVGCNDKNQVATVINEATKLTTGKSFPYCEADWGPFVSPIVGQI